MTFEKKERNLSCAHFEKMNPLCANFSFRFHVPARTRWVSFTNYTRLETRIFQTLFLLNIKINFTSGQFWHFFGWRKTMPFRLIFRFERRCSASHDTKVTCCGNFTFLSIFKGSWPPYSFLASILSSARCRIKLSPFALMHSYLIRTKLKRQISINYFNLLGLIAFLHESLDLDGDQFLGR